MCEEAGPLQLTIVAPVRMTPKNKFMTRLNKTRVRVCARTRAWDCWSAADKPRRSGTAVNAVVVHHASEGVVGEQVSYAIEGELPS